MQRLWGNIEEAKGQTLKIRAVQIIYNMDEVRQKILQIQELSKKLLSYFEKETDPKTKKKLRRSPYKILKNKIGVYQEEKQKLQDTYE